MCISDGEHQLLHTIGLCLLYRHESVLFLLDEPETHLNPDWRASYIFTLRAALEADESTSEVMREVLQTSHSPFIISDCRKENVLVFTKDRDSRDVAWAPPEFDSFIDLAHHHNNLTSYGQPSRWLVFYNFLLIRIEISELLRWLKLFPRTTKLGK